MASHKQPQQNTPALRQTSQAEANPAGQTTPLGPLTPGAVLALQRALGNQAVLRLRAVEQRPARPPATRLQRNGAPSGLPNRLFDCFLNAILQIMAGPYADVFDPGKNKLTNLNSTAAAQEIQAAVWALIQRINKADQTAITEKDIGTLRETLFKNKMVLSQGEQEDAAELMRKLLEPVLPHDQTVEMGVERTIDERDTTPLVDRALGSNPATYTKAAPTDKTASSRHTETSNMIAVDMDRYNSLPAFLYEQFGQGVVTEFDAKNRPTVKYNNQGVESSKVTERRSFTRLPNLVTFNLKRFRERFEGGKERISKPFAMPKSLFLVSAAPAQAKRYVEYELAGVVVQTGTLSGGHYYGHIKRGDQWHKANDATVTDNQVDQDINQGYIYTYRRVKEHSALPKDAQAAQETAPKPGDIDLNAELSSYSGLLDSGAKAPAKPVQGKPSERIRGLGSKGDDCFLNAVLQLMAGPFAELFDPSKNKLGETITPLQTRLWGLMQGINKADSSKPGTGSITKEEIGQLRAELVGSGLVLGVKGQEDAAEVVRKLLARVTPKQDAGRIANERSFDLSDANPIAHNALPDNPASYRAGRSTSPLDANIIEVEIGKFNSLEGFLYHHYGVGETIEYDAKNRPKVQNNGMPIELSKITQRKTFRQLPPLMTFILHRFQINKQGQRQRIDGKFAMPEQLLLVEQTSDTEKQHVVLELVGVVVQTGQLDSGHYYTHRKDGKNWLRANDATVTESDAVGPDLHEGYIYTYRRSPELSSKLPTTLQAPQENPLYATDDLGLRLLDRIARKGYAKALELLDFPAVDVNARTEEHGTPLYQAVIHQQPELVRRLLMRGADPKLKGPKGSPQEVCADPSYKNSEIKMALQVYSMSDMGTIIGQIKSTKPKTGEKLDPKRMLAVYDRLDAIEELLKEQAGQIATPDASTPETLNKLAQGLAAVQQQRRLLNEWLAEFYEIKRAGAGKRPDASKATRVPLVSTSALGFLHGFLQDLNTRKVNELNTKLEDLKKEIAAIRKKLDGLEGDELEKKQDELKKKQEELGKKEADRDRLKKRTPQQMLASDGKMERDKDAQEALTALFAHEQGMFKQITPGKGKFAGDIDLQGDEDPHYTDPKDRKGKAAGWDQKALVQYGNSPFKGRLVKTHHKLRPKASANATDTTDTDDTAPTIDVDALPDDAERIDSATRPGNRTDKAAYQKVGLLLDSTYIDERNYERIWQTILKTVLHGHLDPRYIKETRAPEDVHLISENFFDVTDREKQPWALSTLTAEKLATAASPMSMIGSAKLPGVLQKHLEGIIAKTVQPFTQHENNRNWLPTGFLYFEYATPGDSPKDMCGNHCKLVVSHDLKQIYLTCSHYKGFSYQNGTNTISRPPFYAITPEGSLAAAMGIATATPSAEATSTAKPTTGSTNSTGAQKKEKRK